MPKPEPKPAGPAAKPAVVEPAVKPAPTIQPPTPQPAPAAPIAAPATTGRFADKARSHLSRIQGLPSTHLTLQLMIACQEDSIAKALAVDRGGALWFIPFDFKGKACYKVYWGEYSSAAAAQDALAGLPDEFKGGKPQVVSLGAALKNASP
jgi:septal ring-binding cell division protein DamX